MALQTEIKSKGLQYLSFVDFDEKDSAFLKKTFKFHELDLEDCASEQERPKIDEYDDYIFIVLQIPRYDKRHEVVDVSEVNLFVGMDYLVLSHDDDINWLKNFETALKTREGREDYLSLGTGYLLYKIIEGLFESRYRVLDHLNRQMRVLEKEIFTTHEMKDRLKDIMRLKKSIITFRRTIAPQRSVISQLEHKNKKFLKNDLEVYFDDVVDAVERIWQTLELMKETVDTLESTNENLISHYTSDTMRLLTIISVVMLPLTFITSMYGMNIGLPFDDDPHAFTLVVGGMLSLSITMLLIFRYKRWL